MVIFIIISICLLIGVLYLSFRLFVLHESMKTAERELGEISEELFENRVVKAVVPDHRLESLLEEVNKNLETIRSERRIYQENERKLKEQIESVSHDLRTPLTAVIGYLKMIDSSKLEEEDRRFLEIAIKKSYTLQELTGQFYELSRVTSHDFQLKLETVDACRILKETCLENYSLLEQAGLNLTLPAFDHPVFIIGNGEALNRVFSNMIQNSIRYAKGELRVDILQNPDTKTAEIQFANDIRPEQEVTEPERLFERFYMQEHTRRQDGTGLGLTISRTLTECMGGTMKAAYSGESEKRFLTFTIQFYLI